ncbi:MAG: hypothetical protein J6Y02_13060 [Pseudobutyrivibrio sp.]|nr:hypothetical protein [Pseudobutyrivibrio sp.]
MNLGFIKPAWIAVRNFTVAHSTTILTSVGVAGVVGTAVSASVASVKSYKTVKEVEEREKRDLEFKEKVKLCWKYYIPTIATGATTISAVIGSNIISGKKEAAMASALALAEKSFEEYKDVVAEKLGAEAERELQDEVIFDKIADTDSEDIHPEWTFETHGKTLCYDYYCGRYFMSDPAYLRSCEGEINRKFLTEGVVMLQDVYDEVGFYPHSWIGRTMGWELPDDMVNSYDCLRFLFDSKLTRDNKPVLVVRMNWDPKVVE